MLHADKPEHCVPYQPHRYSDTDIFPVNTLTAGECLKYGLPQAAITARAWKQQHRLVRSNHNITILVSYSFPKGSKSNGPFLRLNFSE